MHGVSSLLTLRGHRSGLRGLQVVRSGELAGIPAGGLDAGRGHWEAHCSPDFGGGEVAVLVGNVVRARATDARP
eukprot:9506019-Alexandrium_andersonii.AAC.1